MPWDEVMEKWKSGKLKSGNKETGKPVKNQKQAVAIMLSEKRAAEGGNYPCRFYFVRCDTNTKLDVRRSAKSSTT